MLKDEANVELELLPPYSPVLGPCENVFSMLKTMMCSSTRRATGETLANLPYMARLMVNELCPGPRPLWRRDALQPMRCSE